MMLAATGAALVSCDSEENTDPIVSTELRPDRIEQVDYTRELIFDTQNRLVKVISTSEFPNDGEMVSTQEFTYGDDGHLKESITDSGWRLVYTYDGEFIVRTDEYVDDVLSQ